LDQDQKAEDVDLWASAFVLDESTCCDHARDNEHDEPCCTDAKTELKRLQNHEGDVSRELESPEELLVSILVVLLVVRLSEAADKTHKHVRITLLVHRTSSAVEHLTKLLVSC